MTKYTYEKEPLIISADNHPANIVVFQARDIEEACRKADEAISRDGIEGAVWQKTPEQIEDTKKTESAHKHVQTTPANIMHWLKGIAFSLLNKHYGPFLYRSFDNGAGVKFKLNRDFMAPHKHFEPSIAKEILQLARMFTLLTVDRRIHDTSNSYVNAHFDGKPDIDTDIRRNKNLVFNGHGVRILAPRKKAGTYIFHTNGKKGDYMCSQCDDGRTTNLEAISTLQPWVTIPGQYLFIHGLGRLGKAILHDWPIYEATKEEPRIIDVFDCRRPRTTRSKTMQPTP
ncbi:MAG: hypothetical protein CMH32_05625 [Micavibrio sp.]|nr:hypothetical protein [Micavibrio sp.]HCK32767.1 hypothetical protein [Rhodospirillaceae bacterium]|tara:strand:- start:411 stop:1265 length:855 start_codon:yes stop_codon:yes gene_type:complete